MAEQHQQQHRERLRQVRREGVEAEDAEADRGEPVGQGRFLEVADAVHAQRDEVPVVAMARAALAWVASASSSTGGQNSAAKKSASHSAAEDQRRIAGPRASGEGGSEQAEVGFCAHAWAA